MNDPVPELTPPLKPSDLTALDALALALYRASYGGESAPNPEHVMIELLQEGWMISPLPDAEDALHPRRRKA